MTTLITFDFPISIFQKLFWLGGEDGLPVQDGVPEHALVSAVEVAVNRIEIESDDVAAANG